MFMLLEASAATQATTSPWTSVLSFAPIVLIIIVMYFVMIRPQKKQEKKMQEMLSNLAVGDEVTTRGGIIGKIVSIKEETVVIETSHDRTRIRFLRSAISTIDVKAEDAQG